MTYYPTQNISSPGGSLEMHAVVVLAVIRRLPKLVIIYICSSACSDNKSSQGTSWLLEELGRNINLRPSVPTLHSWWGTSLQAAQLSQHCQHHSIELDTLWSDAWWQISCCTIHSKYVGIWDKYTPCHLLQCLGNLIAFLLSLAWKAVVGSLPKFHPLSGFSCEPGEPETRGVKS